MALMQNMNWFQQEDHTEAERTYPSPCRWISELGAKSQEGHIGFIRGRHVYGRWAGPALPAAFPSGKLSDTNPTAARLHVTTGNHVMSSCRKSGTNTPTFLGKIKGPLLSFIFLALHLLGSQVASHGPLFSLRSAEFIGSACVGYTHAASTNLSGNMDAAEVFRLKPL